MKYKRKSKLSVNQLEIIRSFSCLENPNFEIVWKNSGEVSIFLHARYLKIPKIS